MEIPYPAKSFRRKIPFVIGPGLWAVAADGEVNIRPIIRSRISAGGIHGLRKLATFCSLFGLSVAAVYQGIPGKQARAEELFREAVQIAEEKLRVNPRDSDVLSQLAVYHADLGNRAEALARLKAAIAAASSQSDVCFRAAQVHERTDNRNEALKWLGKALESGYPLESIERSPDMKELRSDLRYAELLRRWSKRQ